MCRANRPSHRPPRAPSPLLTLAEGEDGLLSLTSLWVVFGFLLILCAVMNTGWVVTRKVETQNAADAGADAAGVEMARGLNAVTAANHLIGELTALVVAHHALGGDELDGLAALRKTPGHLRAELTASYAAALDLTDDLGPGLAPLNYAQVKNDPGVGAAIGDARVRLQEVMAGAYAVHAVGGALAQWPPTRAAGIALIRVAQVVERKVGQEWRTLAAIEKVARSLDSLKKLVQNLYVPELYRYSQDVVRQAPQRAEQAAGEVGQRHGIPVTLFPGLRHNPSDPPLALPVRPEPQELTQQPARSQLVRATTPWVQRWRQPILQFAAATLTLSDFGGFYRHWTDDLTLSFARRLKQQGLNLYVLDDLDLEGHDKGREPWTRAEGSRRADQLFGVVAFALHAPLPVMAYPIFRQTNPNGVLAYSQVMAYNANPQDRPRHAGWQPVVGWDTLNWDAEVPEHPDLQPGGAVSDPPQPTVRLNWQCKLVPTTRLKEGVSFQGGDLGAILRRLPPDASPLDSTH